MAASEKVTVKEQILELVRKFPGITDTELEHRLHKTHQHINQECRSLEKKDLLIRRHDPEKGCIGNYSVDHPVEHIPGSDVQSSHAVSEVFDEDAVKRVLKNWLESQGWTVAVAWGHSRGVDVEAVKDGARWLIEVKGPGSRPQMRVNYFLCILGETLQRMDDGTARYSIAFPDMAQYRNLWTRLPGLAKQRTRIDLILVAENGGIDVLE